ncbi:uncharacterized protein BDZ99DRAFT_461035 [Mytilinidion resinicola]|uniref:Uncharacterized protein n=1 Tax=Mytilinidion resinicola TaxID=574789 RepID=A0A6A6YTQ3_9PEZI|nr:uncharacterized protein BDZ99DRAFT_461035 [Mytilinidion resinicola]KAF2812302.1 hypothetical protein BDZ99DRAFT_461035 [Mytilinidion resinicola]
MASPNPNDGSGKSPFDMPDDFSYQFMGPPTTSASAQDLQFTAASSPPMQATDFQIRPSPVPSTQYQFITTTGEEDSATSKRKLKTVRSHVMRNFLQQQQQQRRAGQTPASSPPSEYLSVEVSPEEQGRRKRSKSWESPPPGQSRKSSVASSAPSTLEQQMWASSASYQGAGSPNLSGSVRRGSSQSTVPSPCTYDR